MTAAFEAALHFFELRSTVPQPPLASTIHKGAQRPRNLSVTIRYMIRWIPAPASAIPFVFLLAVSLLPASAFANSNTFSFSQNHQLWDRGAEIKALQQFLNAQGVLVARNGPGSPGDETT